MGTETHSTTFSDGTQVYHQFEFKKLSDEDKKKLTLVFAREKELLTNQREKVQLYFPRNPVLRWQQKFPEQLHK